MTRPNLIALIAAASICLLQGAFAESPDEKAIHEVLEASIAADFDSDFPRLASLLHPTAQRLFRDQLSARFDELLRVYPLDHIRTVSGLPVHPKDLKLSDPEFFVFVCEQAKARHPDFVGDPAILPFDIRETVFHGNSRVDVTLSYSRHVRTERTDFRVIWPLVIVLQRDESRWQILSCPLANTIAYNWKCDLAACSALAR